MRNEQMGKSAAIRSTGGALHCPSMLRAAHRRLATWIACLGVLMYALAPTISQALSFPDERPWESSLCSARPTWTHTDTGTQSAPIDQSKSGKSVDCPFCTAHCWALPGTLSVLSSPFPPPKRAHAAPKRDAQIASADRWPDAHSRAPPGLGVIA
jgi:hypothetical protein